MKYSDLKNYTSLEELRKFTEKLIDTTAALKMELEQTKARLQHSEEIAKFSNNVAIGSNEEELCKLEINRLYQSAKNGPLEFNEIKAFEIYVKSLMLIRGKTAVDDKKAKKEPALDHDQLLQLALQVVDDTTEQ
jgi:hypothetical protein